MLTVKCSCYRYLSGDMSVVLDAKVKEMVCEMSGKDDVSEPLCSIDYVCMKQCICVCVTRFCSHTPTYSLIPCSRCAAAID